jgi:hypothetical protein
MLSTPLQGKNLHFNNLHTCMNCELIFRLNFQKDQKMKLKRQPLFQLSISQIQTAALMRTVINNHPYFTIFSVVITHVYLWIKNFWTKTQSTKK